MTRQEVYNEIEGTFGLVPAMFRTIPDDTLEMEWRLFKRLELDESIIPNKYRELMGLAVSAVSKCRYCALYHTEVAKLFGATDEEVEEAVHYAKTCSGWSTYINGLQVDYEQFRAEIMQACDHVRTLRAMAPGERTGGEAAVH